MAKKTLNAEEYGGRDKGLNPGSENTFHPVLFRKVDCIEAALTTVSPKKWRENS